MLDSWSSKEGRWRGLEASASGLQGGGEAQVVKARLCKLLKQRPEQGGPGTQQS